MKKTNLSNVLKGKGFYIAVVSCAVVVAGAGIITYNKAVKDINNSLAFTPYNNSSNSILEDSSEESSDNSTNSDSDIGASVNVNSGIDKLINAQPNFMPLAGDTILNPFSNGDLVKSETLGIWKTHDGVDIAAKLGTEVKSMTKGTVKEINEDPMWGNCIVIDHGNNITGYYCNLAKTITVSVGDVVSAGEVIGEVGESAEAEVAMEAHLHFALKRNDTWIDPIEYINPKGSK